MSEMTCPQCGGDVWNNAQKNEQRARDGKKPMPLLTCKDKDGCGWVKWPPKNQRPPQGQRGNGGGTPKNSRPLGPLYYDCLKVAKACVEKELKGATPADVLSATATLFIAASRDGTPLTAPKPKPAPPPESDDDYDNFVPTDEIPF